MKKLNEKELDWQISKGSVFHISRTGEEHIYGGTTLRMTRTNMKWLVSLINEVYKEFHSRSEVCNCDDSLNKMELWGRGK